MFIQSVLNTSEWHPYIDFKRLKESKGLKQRDAITIYYKVVEGFG